MCCHRANKQCVAVIVMIVEEIEDFIDRVFGKYVANEANVILRFVPLNLKQKHLGSRVFAILLQG